MDDFAKFQPYQAADDKIVITFGLKFCVYFWPCAGPVNNVFVLSFKVQMTKIYIPVSSLQI